MSYNIYGFRYPDSFSPPYPVAAMIQERHRPAAVQNSCLHPDVWVLDYCMTNPGKFALKNLPWQARPQNVAHLYPPGTHYMEAGEAGTTKSGFFLFKGETPTLRRLVNNYAGFAQIADHDLHLYDLLRAGAKAASTGNKGYWQLNIVFSQLMDALEQLSADNLIPWKYTAVGHPVENLQLPQKIAAYLEQNYRSKISLDKLAAVFQCSKSTIVHKFQQEHGESAIEMLMRIRVEQSIPLLISGCTLKEIAEAVGFANEFYYSRVFRKITGVSPKTYRTQHQ